MLIATRFGNVNQVHRREVAGRRAHAADLLSRPRVAAARFEPEDRRLLRLLQGQGRQRVLPDLPATTSRTGTITLLTDGKSRNTGARLVQRRAGGSPTARRGAPATTSTSTSSTPKDPKTDRRVAGAQGRRLGGRATGRPDDKQLLLVEGISVNETYLWLVDVATGKKTLADAEGRQEHGGLRQTRAFARDGKGLYVTLDRGLRVPAPRLHGPRDEEGRRS